MGGMTRTWRGAWVVAVGALAGSASADEPPARDEIEVRLLDVGALTQGRSNFIPDRGPLGPRPDEVNDEQFPLFGSEGEEPLRPYGTIDQLIELVKQHTGLLAWQREGSSINAYGSRLLVVRGPAALLESVEAALAGLERDALAWVTVDVLAVTAERAAVSTPEGVATALERGEARVLAATRASGFPMQRLTARAGGVRAFLADYDVEVAIQAQTADPIVSVQPDGMSVDVRPTLVGPDVHLDARLWLARIDGLEKRVAVVGDLEVVSVDGWTAASPMLRARPGEWVLLRSSGEVVFAMRATVVTAPERRSSTSLPEPRAAPDGPLTFRSWPLNALDQIHASTRGPTLMLSPSSFTPPEPPSLPEPMPIYPAEIVMETVKTMVRPGAFDEEEATLFVRPNLLFARLRESDAQTVGAVLRGLSGGLAKPYRAEATVVSFPGSALLDVLQAPDGDALLARAGGRVDGRASVRILPGHRAGTFEGRARDYVGDYDVEIAEKASIGNPIVYRALEGISLDVQASLAGGGTALSCEVRYDRAVWRGVRAFATTHGAVELPDLGLQRFRGSCVVPLGSARVLSVATENDRVVAVVLAVAAE
jgi:hypothetical protein